MRQTLNNEEPLPEETAFKKLNVFHLNQLKGEKKPSELMNGNEEEYFLKCIEKLANEYGYGRISELLTKENESQLKRLIEKYQMNPQSVS